MLEKKIVIVFRLRRWESKVFFQDELVEQPTQALLFDVRLEKARQLITQ